MTRLQSHNILKNLIQKHSRTVIISSIVPYLPLKSNAYLFPELLYLFPIRAKITYQTKLNNQIRFIPKCKVTELSKLMFMRPLFQTQHLLVVYKVINIQ